VLHDYTAATISSALAGSAGPHHRGRFGDPRPVALSGLALPPAPMPGRHGLRPLKAWRYVGVFCDELMLCVATVRIGPVRQCFWAIWERRERRLHEATRLGRGGVRLTPGRVRIDDGAIAVDLALAETAGVETIAPSGAAYGWTRKQGGITAAGTVAISGRRHAVSARAIVDDTCAYYERHTAWKWSAGVGSDPVGRALAWNLVAGVNDPPDGSERTVWIDGVAQEVGPVRFHPDLGGVVPVDGSHAGLRFAAEATRDRHENRLLIRSRYRQPFGTFAGELLPGLTLTHGVGVMEEHDVHW